jgi:hypothetical protein
MVEWWTGPTKRTREQLTVRSGPVTALLRYPIQPLQLAGRKDLPESDQLSRRDLVVWVKATPRPTPYPICANYCVALPPRPVLKVDDHAVTAFTGSDIRDPLVEVDALGGCRCTR